MGKHKTITTVIIGIVVMAMMINLASIAVMQVVPTPPPVPGVPTITPVPTTPPHGGGGGGGYTPPQDIYPKIIPIKNSTGVVIGNITAKSATDIVFVVLQTVSVNGQNITISIDGKLVNLPANPVLDVIGEVPDGSRLPAELTLKNLLAQVNLTNFSSGWTIQPDSLKITLKLPKVLAENADLSKSMVIRYDGKSYELLYPSVAGPDANGIISFTVSPTNESFKYKSFSEYTLTSSLIPTPTPVPPTATPTPTPTGGLEWTTILLALILILVVAAAFIVYFWMQKKH